MCKVTKYHSCNVRIDKCMKPIIKWLKNKHIPIACCCGHLKYPMSIIIKEGERDGLKNKIVFREVFSQIVISRTRKFYKRDKQGYYYIPEMILPTKHK